MPDLKYQTTGDRSLQEAAAGCWIVQCLPAEVLPFSWARIFQELVAAEELRGRYANRRLA